MSKFLDLGTEIRPLKEPRPVCVVRLTTTVWHTDDGVHIKKSLRFLKRKCVGYNILYEDCRMVGADEVVKRITNLDECEDGIYCVVTCNESHDWETPHIVEDYDYELIPLK